MNIIKNALLAAAFTGILSVGSVANAEVITYNAVPDVLLSKNGSASTNFTFTLDGFNKAIDTINSAVLSVFLRDNAAGDNESYKITLGSASTQIGTGNSISDIPGYWDIKLLYGFIPVSYWVNAQSGSVVSDVAFNSKALTDFRADGAINVFVEATAGNFYFDKAVLNVDVTKGIISPPAAVPEPATIALMGLGLLGFASSRRKAAKSGNE
nr:PEP-CTERM sorting domain-containing protein [uncultured Noviherbaspirillum sp.]